MNRTTGFIAGLVVLVAVIVGLSSVYTVNMTEQALLLQFGAPKAVVTEPGLHFKLPFVQDVVYISKQLLNLDAPSEEVIASDKKRMVVDAFARYRIVNPLLFYQSLSDPRTATLRLTPILSSNVRRVLGSQNFAVVLSAARATLMQDITRNMNQDASSFGVRIVDVRIRRADLPEQNSEAIYKRMQKERERQAAEYRAEGAETEQRIKARADREVTVLLAEATRESQILRGQGEAQKTRTLGQAYGEDPEFFAFYRSMKAYQDALPGDNTTLVLSPDSDFFRYFGSSGGAAGAKKK
ncbi:MAG: protease modulator HflC [Alphaproteobacteria bacterium]|nr:protease modulator HflC [Alphaproteobacteria bacterium]MDE2012351.1 protease modulator HflC [Alphaproteobacteria bacterium]MDE2074298.1 protease modulator HflC [Alphaproteobacteria bacterium]MDE2353142.1 protease modulator HflC [Alphaproteobacteria bacterium]